jgi:hypothetical protein
MKITIFLIITLLFVKVNSNGQDRSGFDKEITKQALK